MLTSKHYYELVVVGLPVANNEALSHDALGEAIRLRYTIADEATAMLAVPNLG